MNCLFDTHAHLYDEKFLDDINSVLQTCEKELAGMILIGSDLETSKISIEQSMHSPKFFASCGYHPHDAEAANEESLKEIQKLYSNPKIKAAGEMGLDYHYDFSPRDKQIKVFESQIESANAANLPMIIHIREAFEDFFSIMQNHSYHRGVVHCFSGDLKQAEQCLELGFYLSFNGILTFPKSHETREVASIIPTNRVLLETDCPYLAPVPKRGKRNEPPYVKYVVDKFAELKNISPEDAAALTLENARSLFQLGEIQC
jgi:TatD DNase family protein